MSSINYDSQQTQIDDPSSPEEAISDNYSLSDLSGFIMPDSRRKFPLTEMAAEPDPDDTDINMDDYNDSRLTIDIVPQQNNESKLTKKKVPTAKRKPRPKKEPRLSAIEVGYNLFIRRVVDEVLDHRLPLSQQSRRKLDLLESVCCRQFPLIDSLRHRIKIRAYLKLCRRNIKKNNGNFVLKTARHSYDSARQVMMDAYEGARDDLYKLHLMTLSSIPNMKSEQPSRAQKRSRKTTSSKNGAQPAPVTSCQPVFIQPTAPIGSNRAAPEPFIQTFGSMSDKMISDAAKVLVEIVWNNTDTCRLLTDSLKLSAEYLIQ